jgi:serine/threonine protein phosphatase PrpC
MADNTDESRERSYYGKSPDPQHTTPSTSLAYVAGASSNPGKLRKNEDSIFAVSCRGNTSLFALPFGLFVVADGMGGYCDGQEASGSAIQAMIDSLWPKLVRSNMIRTEAYTTLLASAVQKANEAVRQENMALEGRLGKHMMDDVVMSTTLTTAMLVGSTAYVANVGDCRTYLYRAEEGLGKITKDHLVVAHLIEDGILTPEDLYTHPKRNQVYRALYNQPQVEVDLFTVPLQPGDVILLCSRSLWQEVRDPEIEVVIRSAPSDPSQVASVLIQTVLDRNGRHNASAIVVSMHETHGQPPGPDIQCFVSPNRLHLPQEWLMFFTDKEYNPRTR